MLRTQKSTFLNSDFFAKSEIQNSITISKIMKLVQKLNSQQQIEHGGHFYCRHGYYLHLLCIIYRLSAFNLMVHLSPLLLPPSTCPFSPPTSHYLQTLSLQHYSSPVTNPTFFYLSIISTYFV